MQDENSTPMSIALGPDFVSLVAQASRIEATVNGLSRQSFEKAYDDWMRRKTWGKSLGYDPMPMPGPAITISVTSDGGFAVALSGLVASIPVPPEAGPPNLDPIGAAIPGGYEYDSTPYGDTFPAGAKWTKPDGSEYVHLVSPNPFSQDGKRHSWIRVK